jgi:7-cyano-7-deazaguanine synthase
MARMTTALLLSGGMDSIAVAFWKRPDLAITIDYGQVPAKAEIRAASAAAEALGIKHIVTRVDAASLGSGDMAGKPTLSVAPRSEWWPYRNQLLITLGAAAALPLGASRLLIGTLSTDAHHADGRQEFIQRMSDLLAIQEGGLTVGAPAIEFTADELVAATGVPLEVLAWAHSCHRANYACGECGGCRKHYRTMVKLGVSPY